MDWNISGLVAPQTDWNISGLVAPQAGWNISGLVYLHNLSQFTLSSLMLLEEEYHQCKVWDVEYKIT
jgi:hypothetical protein